MLVSIFRSNNKLGAYIFLPFQKEKSLKENFVNMPHDIVKIFSKHDFVMDLDLSKKQLAHSDNNKVIETINNQGFYLQLIDYEKIDETLAK